MVERNSGSEDTKANSASLPPVVIWVPTVLVTTLFVGWCCALGSIVWTVAAR